MFFVVVLFFRGGTFEAWPEADGNDRGPLQKSRARSGRPAHAAGVAWPESKAKKASSGQVCLLTSPLSLNFSGLGKRKGALLELSVF